MFEPERLQLGDRKYYVIKESSDMVPVKSLNPSSNKQHANQTCNTKSEGVESSGLVEEAKEEEILHTVDDAAEAASGSDSDYEDEDIDSDSASLHSAASLSSNKKKAKKHLMPVLLTKPLKSKKLKRAKTKEPEGEEMKLSVNDRVCVEVARTYSTANVVWQVSSLTFSYF